MMHLYRELTKTTINSLKYITLVKKSKKGFDVFYKNNYVGTCYSMYELNIITETIMNFITFVY